MGYAVRFEGVTKRYPRGGPRRYASLRGDLSRLVRGRRNGTARAELGHPALNNVSFEVEEGESLAIIGANGAGKTTALKIISRISYPSGGRVRVRGRVGALLEVGSGVHPELTARENIWLYGQILGMGKTEVGLRFDEIVEFAELAEALDTPVKFYSSGMQLRLGFAIASHLEPAVFVVDEALAVGDSSFQAKCVERMSKVVKDGRTLIFVSHTLPLVREVCSRGILLEGGELVTEGPADEVVDHYLERVGASRQRLLISRAGLGEPLEVLGVRIVSERSGTARVATGDRVRLEVDLLATEEIPDAVLGVAVKDERAGSLLSMTMLSDQRSVSLEPGEHRLSCTVEHFPLLPSAYQVWFSATSARRAVVYTAPSIVGTLLVANGPEERRGDLFFATTTGFGPVHADYRMTVAGMPASPPPGSPAGAQAEPHPDRRTPPDDQS